MANPNSPRAALERAQYFLAQAEGLRGDQRTEFGHNLDAAIVFGRSAYHFLQSRATAYGADPAYVAWFNAKKAAMASDRLLEYFRQERDTTLKERHRGLGKRITAAGAVALAFSSHAEVRITRAQPWYTRSPAIIWQDTRAAVMRPLKRWQYQAGVWLSNAKRAIVRRYDRLREWWKARQYVPSVREFYIDDPERLDRNAVDLVREYLNRLDAIVTEAEGLFAASVS